MSVLRNVCFTIALISLAFDFGSSAPTLASTTARLTGATDLRLAEAPFAALVWQGTRFCSGAVISQHWILFAAHCDLTANSSVLVADGLRKVVHVVRHPGYRITRSTIYNDVAIARLDRMVGPIARAVGLNRDESRPINGETVFAYGFGAKNNRMESPRQLRRAGMTALELNSCRRMMHPALASRLDYRMHICANEWKKRAGICSGDSGAPLLAGDLQVGIASYRLGDCGDVGRPDVYARISPYVEWIEGIAGPDIQEG